MESQQNEASPAGQNVPAGPVLGRGYSRQDWQALAAVLLLAIALRGVLCTRLACISRDGAQFISYARQLADDPIPTMKTTTKQPGFPVLLLGVHGVVDCFVVANSPMAWQYCGQALALIGGVGVCAMIFVLTRRLFDTATASTAGVLAAVWPQGAQHSADVLSDMPHLALYLLALYFAYRAIGTRRPGWLALCGLIAGIAYMLRQEALGIVLAGAICWAWPDRRCSPLRRLAGVAVLVGCFAVVIAPHSIATGKLMPNKNPWELLFGKPQQKITTETRRYGEEKDEGGRLKDERRIVLAASRESGSGFILHPSSFILSSASPCLRGEFLAEMIPWWKAPPKMIEAWAKGGRYVISTLFLLALVLRSAPRAERTGRRLVIAAVVLQLLAVQLRIKSYGEISSRYMMIPLALSIPWAASGLLVLLSMIAARLRSVWNVKAIDVRTLGVVVVALPMLYYLARPVNYDKAPYRQAGDWIAKHTCLCDTVLAPERFLQIMFYAGRTYPDRTWIQTSKYSSIESLRAELRRRGSQWFIDDAGTRKSKSGEADRFWILSSGAIPEVHPVWSSPVGGSEVGIFRVYTEPAASQPRR